MEPRVFTTINHGVPWYGVVVLAALTWAACRLLEEGWYRAVDWWQDRPDRVEDPDRGDGSGPLGRSGRADVGPDYPRSDVPGSPLRSQVQPFLPNVPPDLEQRTEPYWVLSANDVLHVASCRRAGLKTRPWLWADSVEEARIVVDARDIATCTVCKPTGDDDDEVAVPAGDEAVVTS